MNKYLQKKKRIQQELKSKDISPMRKMDLQQGLIKIKRLISLKRKENKV